MVFKLLKDKPHGINVYDNGNLINTKSLWLWGFISILKQDYSYNNQSEILKTILVKCKRDNKMVKSLGFNF